jgi:hypothetical protein
VTTDDANVNVAHRHPSAQGSKELHFLDEARVRALSPNAGASVRYMGRHCDRLNNLV